MSTAMSEVTKQWNEINDWDVFFWLSCLDDEPIGEIVFKNIDTIKGCCTLGIHLRNDDVKNKGYGTTAEILAIRYAFDEMKINTVCADAIHKNRRSQHVLKKVGFREVGRDETFIYYECRKESWTHENPKVTG